jgi:hydrogenase small subunit
MGPDTRVHLPDDDDAMSTSDTFYEAMRSRGISRRDFLTFCTMTTASLGLAPSLVGRVAQAMETKPRIPVIWLHGLECTCCSESFIRSSHPLASDVILSMISLDYDDLIMAAAGHQAEAILDDIRTRYKGNYILAVEGNPALGQDGMSCIIGGRPFVEQLKEMAADCKAVIAWGSCASWGCVQAAKPNPTQATPVDKVIRDKPVIKVPGCPPIAEVMTGVLTYMLTFERIPELDRQGRPKMFYGQRIHDKCYRRPHFDAGQFVEAFDDEGARKGWCLYKVGCKGPTTYNACSTVRWNNGVSFPIQSGHGCIGCSEDAFWDKRGFYQHVTDTRVFGIEANADKVGLGAVAGVGAAIGAHAAYTTYRRSKQAVDAKTQGAPHPEVAPTDADQDKSLHTS